MYAFDYHRPQSRRRSRQALRATSGAKLLAGGQTLHSRHEASAQQTGSASLTSARSRNLRGIRRQGRFAEHRRDGDPRRGRRVARCCRSGPGPLRCAEGIGDPQVRNRGTIGGSVANNDPAADYPAAVLALGATLKTNRRSIAADDFFHGLFATALDESEILTRDRLPRSEQFAYAKFANPASRYALVGVAVAKTATGVRVAVTGAGSSGVFRHDGGRASAGRQLVGARRWRILPPMRADMMSDIHADAAYRAHLSACWPGAPWRRWASRASHDRQRWPIGRVRFRAPALNAIRNGSQRDRRVVYGAITMALESRMRRSSSIKTRACGLISP